MSIRALRFRLADDVYYARTDDGVYVRGGGGHLTLSGRSSFEWLDRLAPHLDGTRPLGELCTHLSASHRAVAERIVAALHARGLVVAVEQERPHRLGPAEQTAHQTEIGFIGQFTGSAGERFQRYRDTRVLALGGGAMIDAWLTVARRSGLHQIQVGTDAGDTAVAGADIVVHLSDTPEPERAVALDRMCRAAGKPLLQAVPYGRCVWVGLAGWESVSSRIAGLGGAGEDGQPMTSVVASVAASHLASLCFRHLTGILQANEQAQVTAIDLVTLNHNTHTVIPHPYSFAVTPDDEGEFLARIARLRAGRRLTEQEFSRRSVDFYDRRLGVFADIDEHDIPQLPLRITEVTVSDAMRPPTGGPSSVAACGVDFDQVRRAANRRAFEAYASSTMDKRRLVGDGLLWCYDIQDATARLVDAEVVFPGRDSPASARSAVGSGLDWTEAVQAGLLGLCRNLVVSDLTTASEPYPKVDLSCLAANSEGRRHLTSLSIAGVPVTVYDLSGHLGVPTFAFCVDDDTVTYTSALDPGSALDEGLREVLMAHQTQSSRRSWYSPGQAVPLPARLRGRVSRDKPSAVSGDDLVNLLAAKGYRLLAAPLDHDPAVSAVFPYVVRMVAA